LQVLEHAIAKYGEKAQLVQACEELAELTQAVSKAYRFGLGATWNELAEEMADVEIMLEQLYLMLPRLREDVPLWKDNKLARLKKRIDMADEAS
jgi:NTP pyrophosphatase (non-canonical NTP hydrolase)